jgi:uncharacterized protein (TIGR03435 family)
MRKQSAAVFVITMVPVMAAAQQFLTAPEASVDPNTRFEVVAIKTGLTGVYDFTLEFAYEGRMPGLMGPLGAPPSASVDPDAPSLFAALQEQLGLKLEAARGPVEVVVIDKFEKPTLD